LEEVIFLSSESSVLTAPKPMLDNSTYDLLEQLSIESKSLWRIQRNYRNDSAMDNEAKELWDYIEKDKEQLVSMLREKLRSRL